MNTIFKHLNTLENLIEDDAAFTLFKNILTEQNQIELELVRISSSINAFLDNLNIALQSNEFINIELATGLLRTSIALLEVCKNNCREDCVPYCLAAIEYFLHTADSQNDFTDFEGFEDDKIVLEAVIQHFNLESQIKSIQEKTSA